MRNHVARCGGCGADPDKTFINRMAKKYLDQDMNPWNRPDEERVVIVVRPEHTTRMG